MPTKDPHAYASRSSADLQEANPANPNFKAKSQNKKPKGGFAKSGDVTTEPTGKHSEIEDVVGHGTKKGFDVVKGPHGLGEKLRKLVKARGGKDVTKTSY